MFNAGVGMKKQQGARFPARSAVALCAVLLMGSAAAAPGDNVIVVRDLASRIGPILGSALACPDIPQGRIQAVADKFRAVIRDVASSDGERDEISQTFNRYVIGARDAGAANRIDCKLADRQLADLERSVSSPSLASVIAPSAANAAPAPLATIVPPAAAPAVPATPAAVNPNAMPAVPLANGNIHGVTDNEIRFGIVGPFSGSSRELGRQMKLGVDTAFNRANETGGVNGRMLRLIAADDGFEPSRTLDAMKQLYDKDQVFGFIGNVGSSTAA